MIPYCSILYVVSALLSAFCAFRIYDSFSKSKEQSAEYFFKSFSFLTIFFIISSIPGGLVLDPILSEGIYIISWIPIFLAIYYITRIALRIWELDKLDRFLPFFILFLIVSTFTLNVVFFSPSEIITYRNFSFCFEKSPNWLLGWNGAIIALLLLANLYLFLEKGMKNEKRFVRIRSGLIASGLCAFAIGGFLNYVLVPNFPSLRFLIFFSGAFAIVGIILLYSGIQYEKGKEEKKTEYYGKIQNK